MYFKLSHGCICTRCSVVEMSWEAGSFGKSAKMAWKLRPLLTDTQTEIGGGNTNSCLQYMCPVIDFLNANSDGRTPSSSFYVNLD